MKKFIYFLSLFFLSISLSSANNFGDWDIAKDEGTGDFSIVSKKEKSYIYKIPGSLVDPKILEIREYGERYEVVVYFAASHGTRIIVNQYDGAIFDKKEKKFLGHYPFEYRSSHKPSVKKQPFWLIKNDMLYVKDVISGTNEKFSLK